MKRMSVMETNEQDQAKKKKNKEKKRKRKRKYEWVDQVERKLNESKCPLPIVSMLPNAKWRFESAGRPFCIRIFWFFAIFCCLFVTQEEEKEEGDDEEDEDDNHNNEVGRETNKKKKEKRVPVVWMQKVMCVLKDYCLMSN